MPVDPAEVRESVRELADELAEMVDVFAEHAEVRLLALVARIEFPAADDVAAHGQSVICSRWDERIADKDVPRMLEAALEDAAALAHDHLPRR